MSVSPKVQCTPAHPFAEIFPLTEGEPLWELGKRIRANGLREPIVLFQGKILDGRRRELACIKEGIKPVYREFGSRKSDGTDPLEFVIDMNLHRRHLGDGDRKLAAARYATAKIGQHSVVHDPSCSHDGTTNETGPFDPFHADEHDSATHTRAEAANKFEVSDSEVKRAKAVLATGTPALQAAVADDTITVSDAAKVAKESPKVQDQAVADVKGGKAKSASGAVKNREPGDDSEEEPDIEDAVGVKVPAKAIGAFKAAGEIAKLCREMDAILRRAEEISKGEGGRLIRFESFKQMMKDAKGNLWANRATHVCPYCHGKGKCKACKDEGWTAKHVYDQAPGAKK